MITIDTSVLYEDNTVPLKRVSLLEIEPETTYITRDGSRIMVMDDKDFVLVKQSPLNEGEYVSSLTSINDYAALRLLFRLLNKD